jgi:hypothetical protein
MPLVKVASRCSVDRGGTEAYRRKMADLDVSYETENKRAFSAHPLLHHRHPHHLVPPRAFVPQTPPRTPPPSNRTWTRTRPRTLLLLAVAVFNELAGAYNFALTHYTLPTEAATAAVLSCIGDLIAQTEDIRDPEKKQASSNVARTRNYFVKGLGSGVIWSIYYRETDVLCDEWATQLLSTTIGVQASSEFLVATVKTVLAVVLEEVIACPIVFSLWDIPIPAILGGSALSTIPSQVKSKLPELVVENAKVWTLVNILIYNIPVQYRLLVMSVANVFWQSVVSKIASRDVVLENAHGTDESLGIHMIKDAASFDNNTSASVVVDREAVFDIISGVVDSAGEAIVSMASSVVVVDVVDVVAGGAGGAGDYADSVEQGLLGYS